MEKTLPPTVADQAAGSTHRSWRKRTSPRFAVLLLMLLTLACQQSISSFFRPYVTRGVSSKAEPSTDFSWDALQTLPYLAYSPCYEKEDGGYQCARLELPMDYWNGTTDATISLAVIRKPAVVPITDPRYGGAVLLNPGGPGGSGVGFLFRGSKHIRETIDALDGDEDELFYDLISFDPRGVGLSEPAVSCVSNRQHDHSWQVRVMEEGVFESSDAAFGRLWSMSIARSRSCSLPQLAAETGDIRQFVSTASVARDMLEIVERHGQWRGREVERAIREQEKSTKGCRKGRTTSKSNIDTIERLKYRPGEEKIQYWGFSYGTYLGNTFSAMFPDRVHRVVVDGVVDAYNYKQTLWSDNLLDTEKDMDSFYYHCARVGYPTCALANQTGSTSPEGVRQRVADITTSLYHNPLPVISPAPEVITYSDVKNLIFAGLYSPVPSFPYVANLLASVEQGNGSAFAELLKGYHDFSCPGRPGSGFSIIPLNNRTGTGMSYDATMAIACSDGDDQSGVDKTAFTQYEKELAQMSPSIGSMWSTVRMHCIHYSIRALYRFEGPWVAKTNHPLLMVGNTMDPVTPGRFAHKMAAGFEGAVALIQDSGGHCSSSAFSNCTTSYIRRYFQTGELPPVNTTCEADEVPFGSGSSNAEDVALLAAKQRHRGINAALHEAGGGFMRLGFSGKMRDAWFD